jgi:predicted ArsR family transcriptional regulator
MPPDDVPAFDVAKGFAEAVSDAPADERVYRVALQLSEPARVTEVAERADCAPDTARRHLQRFVDLGVITQVTDEPATYQRNESYFEWRKRQRLADCSMDELRDRLETLTDRERTFRERYDADTPAAVDALAHADHNELEDVWLDLSEWQTVRERIERLEAVRRHQASDPFSSGSEAA